MRIRWQLSAISDLANIRDYIADSSPGAAGLIVERLFYAVERLEAFPNSGRRGQAQNTREVIVPGLPYVIVYTHDDASVDVVAVFHAAQNRE